MPQHIIHFTAPINSTTCGQLIDSCGKAIQQGASEIILKIATMGGECSYGFSLYNFLLALPVPLHTHNLGTVESMGNIIFLAGSRRTACEHSKFLFHPFHWNLNGSVDHARMAEYAMSLDYDMHLYREIVEQRAGSADETIDVVACLTASPRILGAQDAMHTGLIEAITYLPADADAVSWVIHS